LLIATVAPIANSSIEEGAQRFRQERRDDFASYRPAVTR
jgi:hypothetical protein